MTSIGGGRGWVNTEQNRCGFNVGTRACPKPC